MNGIEIVAISEPRMSSPAYCNRLTRTVYLNTPVYQLLPDNIKYFVTQHEVGHVVRQGGKRIDMKNPDEVLRSELEADEYAFDQYAKAGKPLHECIQALTRVLAYDKNKKMDVTRTLALMKRAADYDIKYNDNQEAKAILEYINKIAPDMEKSVVREYDNGLALSNRPQGWAKDKFWSAADGGDIAIGVLGATADIASQVSDDPYVQMASSVLKVGTNVASAVKNGKKAGLTAVKTKIDEGVTQLKAITDGVDVNNGRAVADALNAITKVYMDISALDSSPNVIKYAKDALDPIRTKIQAAWNSIAERLPSANKLWLTTLYNLGKDQSQANIDAARSALTTYLTLSGYTEGNIRSQSAYVLNPSFNIVTFESGQNQTATGRTGNAQAADVLGIYDRLRALIGPITIANGSRAIVTDGSGNQSSSGRDGTAPAKKTYTYLIIAVVVVAALVAVWYFFIRKK